MSARETVRGVWAAVRKWWTPERQDAVIEAAWAYAKALFPALMLFVLFGAVWLRVAQVADDLAGMPREDLFELVLLVAGLMLPAVVGIRAVSRTWMRRWYARRTPQSGRATATAHLRAPAVELPQSCRAVAARYGAEFAQYLVLVLDEDATEAEAMQLAYQAYPGWARDEGRETRTDERKARHEAAHAVVAHVLGCAVTEVSIIASRDAGGYTDFDMGFPRPDLATQHLILMSAFLAGRDIDNASAFHDIGAQSDMARLVQSAAAILSTGQRPAGYDGPLTTDALILAAAERTTTILTTHHQAVEAITTALVDRKTIPGAELRPLLPARENGTRS